MIRIIKTEAEYEAALAAAAELAAADPTPGTPDGDRLELLGLLIEDYETKILPRALPSAIEAIEFRMDQLGLRQRDLVPFLGSRSKVSEVLAGKRPLTLSMIRALHKGLELPADVLVQGMENPELTDETTDWTRFPLREMIRRGWVSAGMGTVRDHAEEIATRFFAPLGGLRPATALLRRTRSVRSARELDSYALTAWLARILIRAQGQNLAGTFDRSSFTRDVLTDLAKISWSEQGPALAVEFLSNHGIALVVEPHLPQTHLDGAAILSETGTPIIALTIRHDRIDNFWYSLMHELAHLMLHLAPADGAATAHSAFLDDLDTGAMDALEREADALAGEVLIPGSAWASSPASKLRTPEAAASLATKLGIHPAIVAGRIRHESKGYQVLAKLVGHGEVRKHFPDSRWG